MRVRSHRRLGLTMMVLSAACGSKTALPVEPSDAGASDSGPLDATPCEPRAEQCNERDDDCDGAVDEDLAFGLVSGPFDIAESPRVYFDVEPTETGYLVAYRVDTMSPNPPNLFAQALSPEGETVGEPVELDPSFASNDVGLAPSRDGRFVISYCRRFESGREDGPAWLSVDANGQPLAERHAVDQRDESCVTNDTAPQMVWTGTHHLFAGITSSTRSFAFLERSGPSGERASVEVVRENGDLSAPPRFARLNEGYLLAVGGTFEEGLELTRWSGRGERIGASTFMALPMGTSLRQHRLARGADGRVLVVAPNRFGEGYVRGLLTSGGEVLEDFVWVRDFPEPFQVRALLARRGGGYWLSRDRSDGLPGVGFHRLDADGELTGESYEVAEAGYAAELATRGGRVLLAYYNLGGGDPATLRAATFGCLPD